MSAEPSRSGSIYILSNESMPGLVKIGMTSGKVADRADQLSSTGVPTPFRVEYERKVSDCHKVEQLVHKELKKYRVNTNREFFELPVKHARKKVDSIARKYSARSTGWGCLPFSILSILVLLILFALKYL